MKIRTAVAQKSAVGKNTSVIYLAGELTAQGAHVLTIDLDPSAP